MMLQSQVHANPSATAATLSVAAGHDVATIAAPLTSAKLTKILDFIGAHRNADLHIKASEPEAANTLNLWTSAWLGRPANPEDAKSLDHQLLASLQRAAQAKAFVSADFALMKCIVAGPVGLAALSSMQ